MIENMRKRGTHAEEIINRLLIKEKEDQQREGFENKGFDYFLVIENLEEAAQEIKRRLLS
jgi:guanylate kinase